MKRLSALVIFALLASAPMLASEPSAGATAVAPDVVAGTYNIFYKWSEMTTYAEDPITLHRNHTGTDTYGDAITWSLSGKTITIVFENSSFPGVTATYIGTKNRVGFSHQRNPGTMSNSSGDTGIWYGLTTAR